MIKIYTYIHCSKKTQDHDLQKHGGDRETQQAFYLSIS